MDMQDGNFFQWVLAQVAQVRDLDGGARKSLNAMRSGNGYQDVFGVWIPNPGSVARGPPSKAGRPWTYLLMLAPAASAAARNLSLASEKDWEKERSKRSFIWDDDHLAENLAIFHVLDSRRCILQRVGLMNDGDDSTVADLFQQLRQIMPFPSVGTKDVRLANPYVAKVGLWIETGRRAASEQAPLMPKRANRRNPGISTGVVDDDVDALFAGQLPRSF